MFQNENVLQVLGCVTQLLHSSSTAVSTAHSDSVIEGAVSPLSGGYGGLSTRCVPSPEEGGEGGRERGADQRSCQSSSCSVGPDHERLGLPSTCTLQKHHHTLTSSCLFCYSPKFLFSEIDKLGGMES